MLSLPFHMDSIDKQLVWTTLAILCVFAVVRFSGGTTLARSLRCALARWNHHRLLRNAKNAEVVGTVSGLYVYPVKSLRAVSMDTVEIDEHGFVHDRRLMVVEKRAPSFEADEGLGPSVTVTTPETSYRFLTQRQAPVLATVNASIPDADGFVTLSRRRRAYGNVNVNEEEVRLRVDVSEERLRSLPTVTVGVWADSMLAADLGDAAASFFRDTLKDGGGARVDEVRLVAVVPSVTKRAVTTTYLPPEALPGGQDSASASPQAGFTDGFPILVASETSLRELNRRITERSGQGKSSDHGGGSDHKGTVVTMDRFRPNIVLRDVKEPFAEDQWRTVVVGGGEQTRSSLSAVPLHLVKGCPRCLQSCTDQNTGRRTAEPLLTLGKFRRLGRSGTDSFFAVNAVVGHRSSGHERLRISVGDEVRVVCRGKPVYE